MAYYQILAPHGRPDGMKAFGLVTGELRWSEPTQEWFWVTNHHLVTVGSAPLKSQGKDIIRNLIDSASWPNDEESLPWPADNVVISRERAERGTSSAAVASEAITGPSTNGAGQNAESKSQNAGLPDSPARETDRMTATVAEARELLDRRSATVTSEYDRIVQRAKIDAFSEWPLVVSCLQNIQMVVSREGADGSALILGWAVEQTKKKPALWDFTDDVKHFHLMCVGEYAAQEELSAAERKLHKHRLEHDSGYAAELEEKARAREAQALAAAQAKEEKAAAQAEADRAEVARVEAARVKASRAKVAKEHDAWVQHIGRSKDLAELAQLASRGKSMRQENADQWDDAAFRSKVEETLGATLTRLATQEHEILTQGELLLEFAAGDGIPDSQLWNDGVQAVPEASITSAKDVLLFMGSLAVADAVPRQGLLDEGFWVAIEKAKRSLHNQAVAKAAAQAAAKSAYQNEFLANTGAVDSLASLNELTRRVREGQSNSPKFWDDDDVAQYVKMQRAALKSLLGWQGSLPTQIGQLFGEWEWRTNSQFAHKWPKACVAFPDGLAASLHTLFDSGCLVDDVAAFMVTVDKRAQKAEFWAEVVSVRKAAGSQP